MLLLMVQQEKYEIQDILYDYFDSHLNDLVTKRVVKNVKYIKSYFDNSLEGFKKNAAFIIGIILILIDTIIKFFKWVLLY